MTWSIVTHDPATGAFAVAVATRAFAVGASCPFVRAGVGAVSTQSMTNRYLGPAILDGLARGLDPAHAIEGALTGDAGSGLRQVHAVDRHGRTAAWTGRNCVEWCGSVTGAMVAGGGVAGGGVAGGEIAGGGVSVAGNMLAGEAVVAATLAEFLASGTETTTQAGPANPLPERLIRAMLAGQDAGGDRRGRQSAAMRLITTEDFPDLDLRVDDHPDPLAELDRLLGLWREQAEPRLAQAPRRGNPSGFTDLDAIEAGWRIRGLDLRFRR
ncbi:MAG TPA: DUF1028 domain-containing protein [Acetobacteraceae bacterium]|jgi:uncharacterized Ntn-hydrolase superfamily protein|nr:DUF1028 domain-containing protein [Acetobacteraceae bacterium]